MLLNQVVWVHLTMSSHSYDAVGNSWDCTVHRGDTFLSKIKAWIISNSNTNLHYVISFEEEITPQINEEFYMEVKGMM